MAICPICKADDAEEIEPGMFDGKTFRCLKHGEFGVSDTVLSVREYMDADAGRWESALANAGSRAIEGRPRILRFDF